jgi:tetratricopeptide (TPR) repeat protein
MIDRTKSAGFSCVNWLGYCTLIGWIVIVAADPSRCSGQVAGDRVVVTANFDTKIHKQVVGKVFGGEIHTVIAVDGKWCALSTVKGWLPIQYVMSLDMAGKHYDERIQKYANDADALATRGMIYFENDDYEKAFHYLNQSLRHNPRNAAIWNNRGIVLHAQRKFGEAIRDLDQAIKLNPKYAKAHENRGLALFAIGNFAEAIKSYDEAIKLVDDNPWSYINRGSARHSSGDIEGAKKDYLKSIELDDRIAESYIGLSNVYLSSNELEKAWTLADSAVKHHPKNALALNARGWASFKLGNLDDAIFDFDLAIRSAPRLSIVLNNRGVCHAEKKNYAEAVKDFDRAIGIDPRSAIAHTNRGTSYMGLKQYQKAKSDFDRAVELAPKMTDAINGLAWFLATCPDGAFRNGNAAKDKAELVCETTDWKEWTYVDTLAAAYAESGDYENAVKTATKACELAGEKHRAECQARLELYRSQQPYRSEVGKTAEE